MKSSFNFLAEYYDPQLREKYSIFIQIFYTLGYILICVSSYLIRDWRVIAGLFMVLPAVLGFIFCIYYLVEIPRYLAKQGKEHMMKVLNSIAKINNREMVTMEDITNVTRQKDGG
jgi:MFS family permease